MTQHSNNHQAPAVLLWACGLLAASALVSAQDLAPRAYLITPTGTNTLSLTYAYNTGGVLLEGAAPITDATTKLSVPSLAYYRSFSLLGRSANALAVLPYGVGTFEGSVLEEGRQSIYRSGLFDAAFRLSVNLVGGPAMTLAEIRQRRWQQKTLIGVSLRVIAPTGQYDPTKLVNLGSNRWTFKPELGFSHRTGHWIFDAYGSVWFFTRNPEFFSNNDYVPFTQAQTEDSVFATEMHVSYDVRLRLWVSLDGNFWYGGRTSLNGVENPKTLEKNSRLGVTASIPVTRHGALKFSYAAGAYILYGGDYRTLSVAWQYAWVDKASMNPKQ